MAVAKRESLSVVKVVPMKGYCAQTEALELQNEARFWMEIHAGG